MGNFLDKFPLVRYTVDKKLLNEFDTVTNVLFRIGIIKDVMENNVNAYYFYIVKDSDRPETLAEQVYGDAQAHWIILYANNIYDPYYDWPMDDRTFEKYIVKKYGSSAWAKTNYHHYEKVITRENPFAQVTNITKFQVNEEKLTEDIEYMDSYDTLTDTTAFSTYTVAGKTVFETISRDRVTYYDYEQKLNEDKRFIKIIQPQYYNQIISELDNLTGRKVIYRKP